MPKLSIITHVYNAQAGLDMQLAHWQQYNDVLKNEIEFVVIDDFSDRPLIVEKGSLNLRHFRVTDDIDWNMPGCRNLAAIQASSPWLLFFDCDNIMPVDGLSMLLGAMPYLNEQTLYAFKRSYNGAIVDPHINTFLISRKGYFRAGGYDEDFAGHYGYEDVLFRNMWRRYCGQEVLLTDITFQQMEWRTTNLNRDTTRNNELIHQKAAFGFPKPKNFLRFGWTEVL